MMEQWIRHENNGVIEHFHEPEEFDEFFEIVLGQFHHRCTEEPTAAAAGIGAETVQRTAGGHVAIKTTPVI